MGTPYKSSAYFTVAPGSTLKHLYSHEKIFHPSSITLISLPVIRHMIARNYNDTPTLGNKADPTFIL